jgi:hypothetical protein
LQIAKNDGIKITRLSPETIADMANPAFLLAVELPPGSLLGLSIHVFTVLEIMMVA